MFPTYENLLKYKGKQLTVPGIKVKKPEGNEKAVIVSLRDDDRNLALSKKQKGGNGIFVFYEPSQATYGYADAGISWACSGPYSGCRFQIGVNKGRIYVAHIAVEKGGEDHSDDFKKMMPNAVVKKDYKTSMEEPTKAMKMLAIPNASKYVFAWWGGDFDATSFTEVTIVGNGMDEGVITRVNKIAP